MKSLFVMLLIWSTLAACSAVNTSLPTAVIPTQTVLSPTLLPASAIAVFTETVAPSPTVATNDDIFTQMGIALPDPVCAAPTQTQTEGPYYKADTPERHSFYEPGMLGTRLILVGYVLDQNCQPLPHAWLDFWQADTNGEYDNAGYRLRGHQFTDAQGRYYLETVLPGLYASRPIEHIHVKVRPEGGQEITSQLYFSQQPVEGLTVNLEDRGDHMLGYFNFVVQR
jgi:protocatechuate 3,4-dioxygenase beta subunit